MPEFKNKEEYEKWKSERSKKQESKIKDQTAMKESINNFKITEKTSSVINKKTAIIFGIFALVIGVAITYAIMHIFKPQLSVSKNMVEKQEMVDAELQRQSIDVLNELNDLKYGFKVGLNYINFRDQKFTVQKKIASIEELFSNKSNINNTTTNVLKSYIAAGIYLDILDCIWKDKIKNSEYYVDFTTLSSPESTVFVCVTDYTLEKSSLSTKPFYDYAYTELKKYQDSLSVRYEEDKKAIESAKARLNFEGGWVNDSAKKEAANMRDNFYLAYINDFMAMYTEEVDKINGIIKRKP